MAKALIGYMNSDLRDPRLAAENSRLRARVGELEALVVRLSEENDKLVAARAEELLGRHRSPHAGDAARLRDRHPTSAALGADGSGRKPGETGSDTALAC